MVYIKKQHASELKIIIVASVMVNRTQIPLNNKKTFKIRSKIQLTLYKHPIQ